MLVTWKRFITKALVDMHEDDTLTEEKFWEWVRDMILTSDDPDAVPFGMFYREGRNLYFADTEMDVESFVIRMHRAFTEMKETKEVAHV